MIRNVFLSLMSLLFLFGCDVFEEHEIPQEDKNVDINWCEYEYRIGLNNDYKLCSLQPVSKSKRDFMTKQFGLTIKTYTAFMNAKKISFATKVTQEPTIFLISMSLLNDKTVFLPSRNKKISRIAGKFYPDTGWLFVTNRMFTRPGYTDFAHEVTHWLNSNGGLRKHGFDDEGTADEMEEWYQENYPYSEHKL